MALVADIRAPDARKIPHKPIDRYEISSRNQLDWTGRLEHLVLPIERRIDWQDARDICRAIAAAVAKADPARYTINVSKAARGGRIFIDYLRNTRGATSVAAYSTRARAGAPVATPIAWDELPAIKSADQYTVDNVPARLAGLKRDPWHDLADTKQALSKSLVKKLGGRD